MQKLTQHLLDPATELKFGKLGGNGAEKGWSEVILGTHAFNPNTGNDAADDGFKFHTGMHLNDGQKTDYDANNNIL